MNQMRQMPSKQPGKVRVEAELARRKMLSKPTTIPAWATVLVGQHGRAIQPKLTVNQPDDLYEQEADAMAEQVMRMPVGSTGKRVQRCACGGTAGPDGECEACKARRLALQRKGDSMGGSEAPASVHQTLNRPGQPLDDSTRDFMESRFGADFSGVRVHSDSQAAQSAQDVFARAYTVGSDVVFGAGQYAPGTEDGKSLLAHELTHVVQQDDRETRVQRDEIEVDLEVPTPEEQERLKQKGVQLPSASSAASGDPRRHSQYVDSKVVAVGFSIYMGGYALYLEGLELPLFVPYSFVKFGMQNISNVDNAIYSSRQDAERAIPIGPPAPGQGWPIAYYRGGYSSAPDIIFPTVFSSATTPRIVQTMLSAMQELGEYVQREMVILALSMIGGFVFRAIINRVARIGAGRPPPSVNLVRRIRPVNGRINVGGGFEGGAAEASNLNPLIPGTGGPGSGAKIPNHVAAGFEDIANVFEANSASQIFSNRLPSSTVNWTKSAQGAFKVMAPGGNLSLNVWATEQEASAIVRAFQQVGFSNVRAVGSGPGTMILGVK